MANARRSRTPRRRKPVPGARAKRVRALPAPDGRPAGELLELVRTGVEKFILNKTTVDDFFTSIRTVAEQEGIFSHQLTTQVFSRIVREAVRKRDHRHPR